jgi:hypothetical protein
MNVTVTASLIAGLSLIPVLASAQPFPAWGDTALIGAEGTDRLGNPTYSKNFPYGIPSPGFVTVQTMAAHGGVGTNNGYNRASGTFKTSVSTATPISQLNSDANGGAAVVSYLSFYDTFTIIGPPNQSGTFQYSLNISGGLTADVNCIGDLLSLQLNIGNAYLIAPNFMNNYSSWVDSNGQPVDEPTYDTLTAVLGKRQSKGGTFVMPAGSSIVIGTLLQSYAAGDNCAMNSGGSYLTLKAITPGFSFSTSSGLKYDKKKL